MNEPKLSSRRESTPFKTVRSIICVSVVTMKRQKLVTTPMTVILLENKELMVENKI